MGKRFTDTDIWDKEWFMKLNPKEKCLIRFIFDKCDVAGIWSPNWLLASAYIGEKVTEKDMANFLYRLEILKCGKIFVCDFVSFQYGKLSEKCKPHIKVIDILKKNNLLDKVLEGYIYPLERVEEKEEDKEEEKEEEEDNKKGVKEKKTIYGPNENVKLTNAQVSKLELDFGSEIFQASVIYLSNYKIEKNYKTADDNLTIRRWVTDAVTKQKIQTGQNTLKSNLNGKQEISAHDHRRAAHAEAQRLLAEDLACNDPEREDSN